MTVPHSPVTAQDCIDAYYQCTSQAMSSGTGNANASAINAGIMTWQDYVNQCLEAAETNRQPALLCQNYIYGAPTNVTQLDSNANFCQGQYNSYVAQGVADPSLGPYEALMSAYCNTTQFGTKISGKTNAQIWQDAYTYSFNITMGSAQIAHFDAQYSYFYNLYTSNGIGAAQANLQALGAVVGQIVGFGGITENGLLDTKAETWFGNAITNNVGTFGTPL